MSRVTIIEIDLPRCSRTYGVAPCTASFGVTGTDRCFNCIRTCQDRENYDESQIFTLRYCESGVLPDLMLDGAPVPMIPSLGGFSCTPARVNAGVDVGLRETVNVMLMDHLHSEAGIDPYRPLRSYDPYKLGYLWPRLRARYVSLQGAALRVRRGESTQDLSEMHTRHYLIDKVTVNDGSVSIVAKDVLILTEDKKAQAPRVSSGSLLADLAIGGASFDVTPTGIGDIEYDGADLLVIGGKEVVAVTRAGDTFTITGRAQLGTEEIDHDAAESVQRVLTYSAAAPSEIIYDLLVNYTDGFDPAWINLTKWEIDVDAYIARLYSTHIVKPTPVVTLLNELIEQIGLIIAWDPEQQTLWLNPIKPLTIGLDPAHTVDNIIEGSFTTREQPEKRASEVWTYYGQRNVVEETDEERNFSVVVASIDPNSEQDYKSSAIKKIHSRWIPSSGRAIAQQINAMLLTRYRDAPRTFNYSLFDPADIPRIGSAVYISHYSLVDAYGKQENVPVQICSVDVSDPAAVRVMAEESRFTPQPDLGGGVGSGGTDARYIFIDAELFNVNLRALYDQLYAEPDDATVVVCVINAAVGSLQYAFEPAFAVGEWPSGTTIDLIVNAPISGAGGQAQRAALGIPASPGTDGLYTRRAISVTNNSYIAGGGGGGALISGRGTDGGGGAGIQAGAHPPGSSYPAPTALVGGGPSGGNIGEFGGGTFSNEAPGIAVDGDSYITYLVTGTIYGPRIN